MEWIEEADGVFRGGGVKGIALAGALCGMAEHPTKPVTRWVNVAGASAGAIIACYLALGHTAREMSALLEQTDFRRFQDPRGGTLGGALSVLLGRGFARGDAFETWFDEVLGGATFEQVTKPPEGGRTRDWRLKLIAVDITNRDLLVLPDDLSRYRVPGHAGFIDPDGFPIARAARMSMSIPYFFQPVELEDKDGRRAVIIDGGTLSNFPVWLFDVDPAIVHRPPARPTFGLNLVGGRGFEGGLKALAVAAPRVLRMAFDIFHTAQEAWDERFVSQSTRVRTIAVDAADVATTEFGLSEERRRLLMANGRDAATEFLDGFELEHYLNTFHAPLAGTPPAVTPAGG
jgi:NTE family protein